MDRHAERVAEYQEIRHMAQELIYVTEENWKETEKEDRTKPPIGEVDEAERQRHRGNYCRSAFAAIEGMCFLLRDYAIRFDESKVERMASQPIFTEDEKAEMMEKDKFLVFPNNIKKPFKWYARLTPGGGHKLDSGKGNKWDKMIAANDKRGKLMHPKKRADLQISYQELDDTHEALRWFLEQFSAALDAHTNHVKTNGY